MLRGLDRGLGYAASRRVDKETMQAVACLAKRYGAWRRNIVEQDDRLTIAECKERHHDESRATGGRNPARTAD